ncbi:hypothetical protein Ancab_006012 [Ancistrocladus abbreviatus]
MAKTGKGSQEVVGHCSSSDRSLHLRLFHGIRTGLKQSHLQEIARCFPGLSKPTEATHDGNMSPLVKNMEGTLVALGLDSSIRRKGLVAEYGSNAVTQVLISKPEDQLEFTPVHCEGNGPPIQYAHYIASLARS